LIEYFHIFIFDIHQKNDNFHNSIHSGFFYNSLAPTICSCSTFSTHLQSLQNVIGLGGGGGGTGHLLGCLDQLQLAIEKKDR